MKLPTLLLIASFAFAPLLRAQEAASEERGFVAWLERLDERRQERLAAGLPLFTPFAAPSYSPEFQFTFSGGFLYTFKTDRADSTLQRSSIPFAFGVSTNGSLLGSTTTTIYGPHDRWRAFVNLWYRDNPDNYWGVGYDNAREREKGETVTAYQRQWFRFNPVFVYRVAPSLYAGPVLDYNFTRASELSPGVATDADIRADGVDNTNAGAGLSVQYDTRDVIQNPYNGIYLELRGSTYGEVAGGQNAYRALRADYRQYHQFGRLRRVLAWQLYSRLVTEGAPWPELTQIGTPFDLRGYVWGRFRDRAGSFALVEYRHMLRHRSPNDFIGRLGWVAWTGVGFVSDGYEDHLSNAFPNVGAGLRFEVEPRMNIRLDVGFGLESSSFYISFNEAF